jgi:hypothetical protein
LPFDFFKRTDLGAISIPFEHYGVGLSKPKMHKITDTLSLIAKTPPGSPVTSPTKPVSQVKDDQKLPTPTKVEENKVAEKEKEKKHFGTEIDQGKSFMKKLSHKQKTTVNRVLVAFVARWRYKRLVSNCKKCQNVISELVDTERAFVKKLQRIDGVRLQILLLRS